jgi:putative transposase
VRRWRHGQGPAGGGKKTGRNPTDRGKLGVKRSVAIEGHGVPIGLALAGANRHDSKLLEETLTHLPVARPAPESAPDQNACLDKAYDEPFVRPLLILLALGAHIRKLGEEAGPQKDPRKPPRRWKVERTISWFNRFRGILIRWAKKPDNHHAFVHFACGVIALRMAYSLADCQFG